MNTLFTHTTKILFKGKVLIGIILLVHTFNAIGQEANANLTIIDLTKCSDDRIKLSEFTSEITYLPLETKDESLINRNARFYLYDSVIVCCAYHQILLFNSEDGRFLRSIGEYGKGSLEFSNSRDSYKKGNEIIIDAFGWQYPLIEYSVNGTLLQRIKPTYFSSDIYWLEDSMYVLYHEKNSNSDTIRFQIFDPFNNIVLHSFYDFRKYIDTNRYTKYRTHFYRYGGDLFVKEFFNDTVFKVTKENLIPKIVFKSGKYSPPFYKKDIINPHDFYYIHSILETNDYIFFQLVINKRTYYCYSDKRRNRVVVPNPTYPQNNSFINDVDNFISFKPTTISDTNVLVGVIQPYEIKKWFDENEERVFKLPRQLLQFKNIDENDNPVLMLVKLKD